MNKQMIILKSFFRFLSVLFCGLSLMHCSGNAGLGDVLDPSTIAVDATNDRLFITQARGELLAFEATSLDNLGETQPVIDDENNIDLNDALPQIVFNSGAFANGSETRLFLMGLVLDGNNDATFNNVVVLDFDGVNFSLSGLSPIALADNDALTDNETDNSFADLVVDQSSGRFYVTDATAGLLYVYNASTGAAVRAPINIGGTPRGMWLDGGRLYICNSSEIAIEQRISVINTTDFTENEINLGAPCDDIAVANNTSGTILVAKRSDANLVIVSILDTDTFTLTELPSGDTAAAEDGELHSGSGISSTINDIVIAKDAGGAMSVYLSEIDGNIEFLTIPADLSSFILATISTLSLDINDGALLLDADGTSSSVFFISGSGTLLQLDVGNDDVDTHS